MIYDISQPVFDCCVFPGDPAPAASRLSSMDDGDLYNLTAFSMCAHNGTHVDAPLHFIKDGLSVGSVPLDAFIGPAYVRTCSGDITSSEASLILSEAASCGMPGANLRILIKGSAVVTLDAALVFASAGILLIGNESQTVGPENAPMSVHLALLGSGVILLEGIRLSHVPDGAYNLCCAPLNLGGAEGAPCRAVLVE